MVVFDAYALIAFLGDEPAAANVQTVLESDDAAASAVNVAEAVDGLQRLHGLSPPAIALALDLLLTEIELRAVSEAEAWRAGTLRARYYHRGRLPLSLADCFLLAAAGPGDAVATADPMLAEVARLEQIEVVALPDSSGRRP